MVELSFADAEDTGDKSYYLAAVVYAYSFMLPGERGTPPRAIDPRFRWAADIYNQALTRAAMVPNCHFITPNKGGKTTITWLTMLGEGPVCRWPTRRRAIGPRSNIQFLNISLRML